MNFRPRHDRLQAAPSAPQAAHKGPPGGPRQRAVIARLAHAEGRLVVVERLVEDLWGADAPASILTTLQGYVSRLRSALDRPERLRRDGPGYVLDLGPDEMDARAFEDRVARARQVVGTDPAAAIALVDSALALWRGPAYADLAEFEEMEWAVAAATRLDELRLGAHELRFDVTLDLGRHARGSIRTRQRQAAALSR